MSGLKKLQLIVLMIVGGIIGLLAPVASQAAVNNDIGFNVAPKIPKNQIDKNKTFFDLAMKSGQTETLRTRIYNLTAQDIRVKSVVNTAWTGSSGAINYVNAAKKYDPSLRYKMSELSQVQGPQVVTVPAKGSKLVTVKVKIPQTNFNGNILGGWYFERVDHKVTGNVKGAGNITNKYAYVVGMSYTMGQLPNPDLKLGKVAAGLSNYHHGVIANLRNPTAIIVPNLKMNTTISNRDGGKTVLHVKKDNVQMAPNTVFSYPLLYGKTKLVAGHYRLHMVVKNTDRTWVFDRNFTVTKAQANKYNADSVDNSGISIWLLIGLGALGMLILMLLILLIIYLIRRRRRDAAEAED
ncbi:MAG: DUF916 and DUF3324 domain-containing protein [Levilactobacillus sp.]|jgi:hypothetical protein|uniref:DUF916 and DUF3324 domain-containing protein n=1 Tax=Levilactobacillus sp. TaxID=2767919 RepID=UPI002589E3BD|nr:DUF916 and DUF3324 domain-containing protein [Levilactobacillus sp.]MCI1553428.1 DUF916 and DUF3324 domain-containing protein [Levilactobacillus sp.]MCI1597817.1 DUF916 and DUF3324 domain-containing protein [Levilactobacillus sp.]MCI1605575.1 DUF916 and DUF3324 domain-containing protein [Levilactobacillus sp.]